MIERHYSCAELAKILGLSRGGVHLRVQDGTFSHVRLGDRILIPESEIARVLAEHRVQAFRRPRRPALAA